MILKLKGLKMEHPSFSVYRTAGYRGERTPRARQSETPKKPSAIGMMYIDSRSFLAAIKSRRFNPKGGNGDTTAKGKLPAHFLASLLTD